MSTMDWLEKIMHFVIGKPHQTMGVAYLLVVLNIAVSYFRTKAFKTSFRDGMEKMFAYTCFIIMANVLDMLAIDNLFGWEGSTQYMVCIYIVAREIRMISNYLTERYGISIPILDNRLSQMEQGQTNANYMWQDPSVDLDSRISRLRNELDALETKRVMAQPAPEQPQYDPNVGNYEQQ